jgi:hypothetical protein
MYEKRKIVEEVIPIVNALKGFKTYFGGETIEKEDLQRLVEKN